MLIPHPIVEAISAGLMMTIIAAIVSGVISLCLAIVLDLIQWQSQSVITKSIKTGCQLLRTVPEMVLLLIFYFGILLSLKRLCGHFVHCPPLVAGIITLSLIYTAYLQPVLTGAKQSIAISQQQAASLSGLSSWQQYRWIILPQSIQHGLPAGLNLAVCLIKDTALLSIIGCNELLNRIQLLATSTAKPFLFYALACLLYLTLTIPLEILIRNKEHHSKVSEYV